MHTQRIPRSKMYRKLLLSYVLLVVATIIIISIVLFRQFSESSAGEIAEISLNMLKQTSFASDVIYQQSFQVANQMISNNTIFTAMYAKETDYLLQYHVAIELKNIKNVYPFIHSVGIYNGNLRSYVDYLNSGYTDDKLTEKLILDNKLNNNYVYFPRTINYEYNTLTPSKNVVTFILYPHFSNLANLTGAFVINIDESYLRKTIQSIYREANDTVLIVNGNGTVVSDSQDVHFLEDYSGKPYIRKILDDRGSTGHFLEPSGGQQQLISFVKSENLGWTFISIRNYANLFRNIDRLKDITMMVAVGLVLLGILASFMITTSIYNPVKALIKRIGNMSRNDPGEQNPRNEIDYLSQRFQSIFNKASTLEDAMDMAYPALVETYFDCLLKGKSDELTEHLKMITDLDNRLSGLSFVVLAIKLDEPAVISSSSPKQDLMARIRNIRSIATEMLSQHHELDILETTEASLLLLLRFKEPPLFEYLEKELSNLQILVEQALQVTISIGCGDIVNSKKEIRNSYLTALEFLNYRFFYGANQILHYDLVKVRMARNDKYDYAIEKKLMEAILLHNEEKLKQAVTDFIGIIAETNFTLAGLFTNQLMISVLRQFNTILNPEDMESHDFYDEIQKVPSMAFIDDLHRHLEGYCLKICSLLRFRTDNRIAVTVRHARETVDEKYANPDLSLESVADQVHLSAGYLGMLFKTYTGLSFGDYLNKTRMEKARDLLVSTGANTHTISEKVGILNSTYFFTLFKKTYGMTPTQYRKQRNA